MHGGQVWVLSEEAPFDNPESSGGCVVGVYATAAAALLDLGTWQIGPAALAEIVWSPFGAFAYEGHGHADCIWILRQHPIQEEEALRADIRSYDQDHVLRPDPFLDLSTADLLAMLAPKEEPSDG